jgi:hypothetical protein
VDQDRPGPRVVHEPLDVAGVVGVHGHVREALPVDAILHDEQVEGRWRAVGSSNETRRRFRLGLARWRPNPSERASLEPVASPITASVSSSPSRAPAQSGTSGCLVRPRPRGGNVIEKILPQIIRQRWRRIGFTQRPDIDAIRQLCREVDLLHPQVDDNGRHPDNVEYPRIGPTGGAVPTPAPAYVNVTASTWKWSRCGVPCFVGRNKLGIRVFRVTRPRGQPHACGLRGASPRQRLHLSAARLALVRIHRMTGSETRFRPRSRRTEDPSPARTLTRNR